jgi:hypothetical protein
MNSILQLHLFTTCLNEALYHIESTGFSWFEPLRIMENEMGVLSGNNFLVDITYSMHMDLGKRAAAPPGRSESLLP